MATKNSIPTRHSLLLVLLLATLFATLAGCTGENKDQPPMEKTATPAPMVDKSGKPMQGPPPGMPR